MKNKEVSAVLLGLMEYHNKEALDAQEENDNSGMELNYFVGKANAHKDSMKHIRLLLTKKEEEKE